MVSQHFIPLHAQGKLRRVFVGIGSNIRPKTNVPLILAALLERVPALYMSRIMETASVDMLDNSQSFYNLTVAFDSELNSAELKMWFGQIETRLGRDRNHPLKKLLGRPADLDEIFSLGPTDSVDESQLPPEPHIRPMLVELLNFLNIAQFPVKGLTDGIALRFGQQQIGCEAMVLTGS